LREALNVAVGDELLVVIEPTDSAEALAIAREQSKVTTAPKKPRADAITPPDSIERPERRPSKRRSR
jgi:hypothetical protein